MDLGIGQPVRRIEDDHLLTGSGCYGDDNNVPGQVYGHVLRAPYAHARLKRIDTTKAKAAPGVRSADRR